MLKYFFLSVFFVGISYGQNKTEIPPGTLKLNDSLFIDKTPVTNAMYLEILKSKDNFWSLEKHQEIRAIPSFGIKKQDLGMNNKALTETHLKIISKLANQDKDYFTHPEYRQYPVLNVTLAEAKEFCLWRSDMVLLLWAINSKNKQQRDAYPYLINYRLPKISELNEAKVKFSKMGYPVGLNGEIQKGLEIVEKPTKFYFYNILEMTREREFYTYNLENKNFLEASVDNIGFRCVCEIIP